MHDLRTWTEDRHRTVDDRPFGGGEGMLLKAEPIFEAVESIWPGSLGGAGQRKVVLLSAQGRKFDQAVAREFAGLSELLLICGRYEGVDERVAEHLADEELSIGDFVLSGGELAAAMVIDVVARLKEGVLGNGIRRCTSRSERTACWIGRSIRGRRNFADGRRRKCCWAGIMRRSGSGG